MTLDTFLGWAGGALVCSALATIVLCVVAILERRAARSRPPVVLYGTERSDERGRDRPSRRRCGSVARAAQDLRAALEYRDRHGRRLWLAEHHPKARVRKKWARWAERTRP